MKRSTILQRRAGRVWEELPDDWEKTICSPPSQPLEPTTEERREYLTPVQVPIVVASITMGAFLLLLDSTIISTAIPQITSEFHSLKDVGWYGAAYQLSSAALQPLVGKLFTIFDIKFAYLTFFLIFQVGSVVCAVTTSSLILILGRIIAGMGVAGMFAGGMLIVSSCIKPESRALCTGIMMGWELNDIAPFAAADHHYVLGGQLGLVSGPLIGGVLTERLSWRWCFYINLPLGALIFGGTAFVKLPNPAPLRPLRDVLPTLHRDLDLVGFLLVAPAVSLLLVALEWGGTGEYAWDSPMLIGLFWSAAALAAAFAGWICYRGDDALIPPRLLKNRIVMACCGVTLAVMGASFVATYWLPIYFQTIKGDTPIWSGVHLLPNVIPSLIMSIVTGALMGKFGYYLPFAVAGGAVTALAGALLNTLTPSSTAVAWATFQAVLGIGRGLAAQTGWFALSHVVPPETLPVAVSLNIFFQYLVGSVLLTVAQVVFTTSFRAELPRRIPGVDVDAIIAAGASGVRTSAVPLDKLADVVGVYSTSVAKVFLLPAMMGVVLFVAALFSGWIDTRRKYEKWPGQVHAVEERDDEEDLTWSEKLDEVRSVYAADQPADNDSKAPSSSPPSHSDAAAAARAMDHTNAWQPSLDRRQSWSKEDQKHVLQMSSLDGAKTAPGFSEKQ
ncbi:MFS multidrug transporter [Purpureocillium lavendulum]|uniref:MFS multidrug transporter n=1 Tax=Purpureocillium lavendulum TaxID=1247861 RepID=A0AB34G0R4_9HYPO|nr:MFS multidrug transporter [Purpureocillium lavendulum]